MLPLALFPEFVWDEAEAITLRIKRTQAVDEILLSMYIP